MSTKERGAVGLVTALVIGALGLTTLGVVMGSTGVLDLVGEPTPAAALPLDQVTVFDCPAGAPSGFLVRGDRVWVTAVDDTGAYVQLTGTNGAPAWITVGLLVPETSLAGLPVAGCPEAGAPATTSTTSTSTTSTTSTSSSSTTTSTSTTSTSSTTTTSTSTTTTTAPDTTPPVVGAAVWTGTSICDAGGSVDLTQTATIQASDDHGITSVVLNGSWSASGIAIPFTRSGTVLSATQVQVTLGPVAYTYPPSSSLIGSAVATVTVRDGAGNETTRSIGEVFLSNCP